MITIQWVVYMVIGCCVCFGVLFLLYSFMVKQVAKQMAKHKEKITFIQSLISLIKSIAESYLLSIKPNQLTYNLLIKKIT